MNKKVSCENNRTKVCEKSNYKGTATFFLMGSYNNRFAPTNENSVEKIKAKKFPVNTNRVNAATCDYDTKQQKLAIRHHPTPWRMPYNHSRKKYKCPPDDKGFTKPDGTISDISNCYNEKVIKDIPGVCENGQPICSRPIYTTNRLVGKTGVRLQNNGGNYNNYLQTTGKLYTQNAFGILPENAVKSKENLYKIGRVNGINTTDLSMCNMSYKRIVSLQASQHQKQKMTTATRKWTNPGFNSRTSVSSRNRLQRLKYNTILGGQQTRNGYNNCVNGEICSKYQNPGDNEKASTNPRLFSLCPPRRNCRPRRVSQACPLPVEN